MQRRDIPRNIPTTPRYFAVATSCGRFDLRLPSYQRAAGLLKLLQGGGGVDGIDSMIAMLDVVGYAVGLCWCHVDYDLQTGEAPDTKGDAWRVYGESVIDEIQEYGLTLGDVLIILRALIEQVQAMMATAGEARAEGNG